MPQKGTRLRLDPYLRDFIADKINRISDKLYCILDKLDHIPGKLNSISDKLTICLIGIEMTGCTLLCSGGKLDRPTMPTTSMLT